MVLKVYGFRAVVISISAWHTEGTQFNPNDTDVFFDACVPGGGPVGPELENRFLH